MSNTYGQSAGAAGEVQVMFESTPNPASLKFIVNRPISQENIYFRSLNEAKRSPLSAKIFGFPWTASVYLGSNFVTITKEDWVEWDALSQPLANLIREHISRGEPILVELEEEISESDPNDPPVVQKIKQILYNEIRPAVAMDGGNVLFHKFEDGIVYIQMQGACAGCPGSTMTLKMGIEGRLREAVPEVVEVVSV